MKPREIQCRLRVAWRRKSLFSSEITDSQKTSALPQYRVKTGPAKKNSKSPGTSAHKWMAHVTIPQNFLGDSLRESPIQILLTKMVHAILDGHEMFSDSCFICRLNFYFAFTVYMSELCLSSFILSSTSTIWFYTAEFDTEPSSSAVLRP